MRSGAASPEPCRDEDMQDTGAAPGLGPAPAGVPPGPGAAGGAAADAAGCQVMDEEAAEQLRRTRRALKRVTYADDAAEQLKVGGGPGQAGGGRKWRWPFALCAAPWQAAVAAFGKAWLGTVGVQWAVVDQECCGAQCSRHVYQADTSALPAAGYGVLTT